MKKHIFLVFIIAVFSTNNSFGITFSHFNTDNGLSNVSVLSLYKDKRGFIWMGTRNGLNLYNGNEVETFIMEKNNPNSLFSNSILKVDGDGNDKIYLHCREGVAEYDIKTDQFSTLLVGDVSALVYNKGLFIGRGNSMFEYIESEKRFNTIYSLSDKDARISSILKTKNAFLIGTSNQGLFLLDKKKGLKHILIKGNITSIYEDSKSVIWVGTTEFGFYKINGEVILNYRNNPSNSTSLAGDFVRTFCEDNNGDIWIGTFNGLSRFNKLTNDFSSFHSNGESGSITHSSIWSIIKDDQGTIWIGTYYGGVNYFNPEFEIYSKFEVSKTEALGLSSSIVSKIIEDKYNNLWICTEGGGLNMYNKKTGTFKWFKHSNSFNSISHNHVKVVYYDPLMDIMWIGTSRGGLNRLDIKTSQFTRYDFQQDNPSALPTNDIYDILPYKGQLIIATDNGVYLFNPQTVTFNQLFKNVRGGKSIRMVVDLLIDHQGTLWLAAVGEGVYSYRFDTQQLRNFKHNKATQNSLSINHVNSMYEDSHKNLWFCTLGGGLDRYNYKTDDFENYDSRVNGLSSDCIYQVCESPLSGKLLAITNRGFSQFDYKSKTCYNFNKENGFPLSAINENSLYLSASGQVFLGGVQGMVSFLEKDLNQGLKPYKIMPYRLSVNGEEVKVNDETGILTSSLYATKSISLASKYNVFTVEFATSNFLAANKSEIVYKLDGFSENWNSIRGQNSITYTNLNAGKYTLIIKTKDKVSNCVQESKLQIEILPPFYKSIFAYILYLFLISTIIYYFLRAYNKEIKLQESLKYEKTHTQDIEKLNDAKLVFFTNISHEFRTPLTLIIGQMEMLLQSHSLAPSIYNKFLGIYNNGLQLMALITELLDFRKQEKGLMKIKVQEHNIVDFLYENYLLFLEFANTKHIKLNFVRCIEMQAVWFDPTQMQKVISNLLSNAFKYTKEGDEISINISVVNNEAVIQIADNGSGISADAIDKVFNRFYQETINDTLSNSGTGIGLALSKGIVELHGGRIKVDSVKGENTVFTICLKLGKNHFSVNQIAEQEYFVTNAFESLKSETIVNTDVEARFETTLNTVTRKILIVEDNESLRDLLLNLFSPFYSVVVAANGQEGLEKINSELPDIVLSDVVMPIMSGTELCKSIKTAIETCHIPVVLLTARTAIEHNIEGLNNGADDYITKPFNTSLLVSRCNNLVNNRIILKEKFSNQPQVTPLMLATNAMDKELLDKIVEIIEKHIEDTEFNIEVFSNEMGMSRTNLFAKIKAVTGETPNDFVTSIRLKKAAFYLRNNPELNITEISYKTGFSSARYFSKCFKSQYNLSPLSYRNG